MVVLLVSVVIGGAIMDKTAQVGINVTRVFNASGADTTPSNITVGVVRDVGSTMSTFTGFLPIAVMGMV